MAFPMKKKPDMTLILGMGPKRKPQSAMPDMPGMARDPEPDPNDLSENGEGAETEGGAIKPEAVCYRTADQHCESCEYMGEDGQCSRLMMPVEPMASCNLYESKGGVLDEEANHMPMGAEEDQGIPA